MLHKKWIPKPIILKQLTHPRKKGNSLKRITENPEVQKNDMIETKGIIKWKDRVRTRNVPETKRLVLGSRVSRCWVAVAADGGKLMAGFEVVENKRLMPRGAAAAAAVLKAMAMGFA